MKAGDKVQLKPGLTVIGFTAGQAYVIAAVHTNNAGLDSTIYLDDDSGTRRLRDINEFELISAIGQQVQQSLYTGQLQIGEKVQLKLNFGYRDVTPGKQYEIVGVKGGVGIKTGINYIEIIDNTGGKEWYREWWFFRVLATAQASPVVNPTPPPLVPLFSPGDWVTLKPSGCNSPYLTRGVPYQVLAVNVTPNGYTVLTVIADDRRWHDFFANIFDSVPQATPASKPISPGFRFATGDRVTLKAGTGVSSARLTYGQSYLVLTTSTEPGGGREVVTLVADTGYQDVFYSDYFDSAPALGNSKSVFKVGEYAILKFGNIIRGSVGQTMVTPGQHYVILDINSRASAVKIAIEANDGCRHEYPTDDFDPAGPALAAGPCASIPNAYPDSGIHPTFTYKIDNRNLGPKVCTCVMLDLLMNGCKCGAFEAEMAAKKENT